ncbi:MAG TPA: type II toxin-antitoxin system VapC family toxin [Gemmataceae bacterium]|nr:type II toxin-antitoxin system VapC family toxin [Gemmataceae bacterium]
MIVLDTDTYTLHQFAHERVVERCRTASEAPAITIVTQIEVFRGRHAAIIKAEDGARLLHAQQVLVLTLQHMAQFRVVPFDDAAAAMFDQLRQHKKLKKIGRADLLIASIVLANRATLVSRNLKDFRQVPGLQVENWAD